MVESLRLDLEAWRSAAEAAHRLNLKYQEQAERMELAMKLRLSST
jgi:hypothetical protein